MFCFMSSLLFSVAVFFPYNLFHFLLFSPSLSFVFISLFCVRLVAFTSNYEYFMNVE